MLMEKTSLANEVYEQQKEYGHPGVVQEWRKLISQYGLPDIMDGIVMSSKLQWKNIVKMKIRNYSEERLKTQFKEYVEVEYLSNH